MPRPFRFRPPSPPADGIARARLVEQIGGRWSHRVVSVVAGPGFGKTALLSTALAAGAPPGAQDVWLTCEPADSDADHLRAGLAQALDRPDDTALGELLDTIWASAPHEVCLVFDDVHELPPGSSGAALLAELTTDLAGNAHLVFASREPIPVPLARLAAADQLVRLGEADLLLDDDELAALAAAYAVEPELLASSGGWPALAALTVHVGSDLVLDYLWEEVLERVGAERATRLAAFDAVGGGDDEMVSAVAGASSTVDELVAGVPLVERAPDGWAALHPLWSPALRRLLDEDHGATVRRRAAAVHRRHRRFDAAIDLLVEAEAWTDVLDVILEAERTARTAPLDGWTPDPPTAFGRWFRVLPTALRDEPEARLAAGIEASALEPTSAPGLLDAAAAGFRARGAVDDELTAMSHGGVVRWWANDWTGMAEVYGRIVELAGEGVERAQALAAFGLAGLAHLGGDSATVLSALDGLEQRVDRGWVNSVYWLQSVAHRRDGDLVRALERIDRAEARLRAPDVQLDIGRQRVLWLDGVVEPVVARLDVHATAYVAEGHQFLAREALLEVATKLAVIGQLDRARAALAESARLSGPANVLVQVLDAIASSAIDIGEGDELAAATRLTPLATEGEAAVDQPAGWYWRDRAAVALVHVLVPETRPVWEAQTLAPCHEIGLTLAGALEAARAGDLGPVASMTWPEPGVVRVHLPVRWIAELAAAGVAGGNPPPDELLSAVGELVQPIVADLATSTRPGPVRDGARDLVRQLAVTPAYRLEISVLGPLELRRDGELVAHPALRRRRVRELLCYLVVHGRVRREVVEEEFWSDSKDPAHNLRVTLDYLRQLLQPERHRGSPSFFVETSGTSIALRTSDRLRVDAWELGAHLDAAHDAERSHEIDTAIEHYAAALPLWRGEPYAEVPYADWAEPARAELRNRYTRAATRVGELWFTASEVARAGDAGRRAIAADPHSEPAARLLARAQIALDDRPGARATLQRCVGALGELGVEPDATTQELLRQVGVTHPG